MTIPELRFKIKQFSETLQSKEIYTALLILLVGLCSFGLGRLSLLESHKAPIQITNSLPFESSQAASAVSPLVKEAPESARAGVVASSEVKDQAPEVKSPVVPTSSGQIVASKTGSKYFYPWCGGAKQISDANKVFYHSSEEAKKAGYAPASNCKGLK